MFLQKGLFAIFGEAKQLRTQKHGSVPVAARVRPCARACACVCALTAAEHVLARIQSGSSSSEEKQICLKCTKLLPAQLS